MIIYQLGICCVYIVFVATNIKQVNPYDSNKKWKSVRHMLSRKRFIDRHNRQFNRSHSHVWWVVHSLVMLTNIGDGSLLGTFGYFDPYAYFVDSADLDKLHQKSEVTGAVFHASESYYVRRTRHDSKVYVWRSTADQQQGDVWYIKEFFSLFWHDVICVRSCRCGESRKYIFLLQLR